MSRCNEVEKIVGEYMIACLQVGMLNEARAWQQALEAFRNVLQSYGYERKEEEKD
jgi:hypothetical protein